MTINWTYYTCSDCGHVFRSCNEPLDGAECNREGCRGVLRLRDE